MEAGKLIAVPKKELEKAPGLEILSSPSSARLGPAERTAAFVEDTRGASLEKLRDVRVNLAGYLHHHFLTLSDGGFEGLVALDGVCPGLLSEAFTAHERSGQYFKGSVVRASELTAREVHSGAVTSFADPALVASLHDAVADHLHEHGLPGTLVVGVNGDVLGDNAGWVTVSLEDANSHLSRPFFIGQDKHSMSADKGRLVMQERAALAALHQVGIWLEDITGNKWIGAQIDDVSNFSSSIVSNAAFLKGDIARVMEVNRRAIVPIFEVMKDIGHGGLSIGESFTGGLLGSLVSSQPGSGKYLSSMYCFYDPGFKQAIGVPEENLAHDRIGEPETVQIAAAGQLEGPGFKSETSIATSGWANRHWDSDGDFFSVAVVDSFGGKDRVISSRVAVDCTRDIASSFERRELTRQLGVTVSLYLLSEALGSRHPTIARRTAPIQRGLEKFLRGRVTMSTNR